MQFSLTKRSTSIDFVENQLSPSLISLSPLTTTHLSTLRRTRVRSSNYYIFNLVMVRSLGFGSTPFDFSLFSSLFFAFTWSPPNGLNSAENCKLLVHYTKGTPNNSITSTVCYFFRFPYILFHSLIECSFIFPSLVLFHYCTLSISRLRGWFPHFPTKFYIFRCTRFGSANQK